MKSFHCDSFIDEYKVSRLRLFKMRVLKYYVEKVEARK